MHPDFKNLSVADSIKQLETSTNGLAESEVKLRLAKFGFNEILEKRVSPLIRFLSYFWGPIPLMIMIAAALSAVLHHWPDLILIIALLLLNAVVGFHEEYQAGDAVAALKKQLAIQALVKRDGKWATVASRELVPGDIVRLSLGNIVPADAKLINGDPVELDQSALTGESLPVERQPGDAVYSGSIIRRGEADALIFGTGKNTFYGKTVNLVQDTVTRSHLQRAVLKMADYLILIAVVLAVILVSVALARHQSFLEVLRFVVVLTIAAVPVAMPAVMSVTLSLGAKTLALKRAIVTRLNAVEEVAGIDILCSDKTGTLTQASLTAGEPFAIPGISARQIMADAALASRTESRDAIDQAICAIVSPEELKDFETVHFTPFDPVSKRTEAQVEQGSSTFKVTKGAPHIVIALDPSLASQTENIAGVIDGFAAKGYRSLGVARTDNSGAWHFEGLIPLFDPLRVDSKETVAATQKMGVELKMLTGDQVAIAKEISKELGLGTDIFDASVFEETGSIKNGKLMNAIEQADGFAQVFPEHKYRIVDMLQRQGHIVGMTGDGVNDAPALKKADAGIAVAGATDAARSAAEIVLLNPGLSVIVDAIKESRKTFQRMLSYAIYRISETIRVLLFLTLAILVYGIYPVTPIMIVLLAILNDGAILTIAYDNTRPSDKPERWNFRTVLGVATQLGIYGVLSSFLIFVLGRQVLHLPNDVLMTMMYLKFSIAGHLMLFSARTRGPFWSIRPAKILLLAVIGTQILATLIAVYGFLMTPLGWADAGFVWAYCGLQLMIQDRVKLLAYRITDSRHGF
nr:plasma-membrane proton-efflux P-type ATPase [Dehalogenimonas formicexedens]